MSTALEISTAQDCGGKLFFFFEETGQYNFLSNPTGWSTGINVASSTNLTIGLGGMNLTVSAPFVTIFGKPIIVGDTILIDAGGGNSMIATVISYNPSSGALVVNVTSVTGAGTYASWQVYYDGYTTNSSTTDALTANVYITNPAGTIYTKNLFSNSFPTTNTVYGYPILNTDIGLSANTQIPDGIYTFKYTVTGVDSYTGLPFIYTTSIQQLFDCNVTCCINEKMTTLNAGCGCNKNNNAVELYTLLESARAAAKCGKAEKAQAIIDYLTTICGTDCGCN